MRPTFDKRDQDILDSRSSCLEDLIGPRVGDYIDFADGTKRRISHIWGDDAIQTSDDGSFYLGKGYVSFSGSLYLPIDGATLTLTDEKRPGHIWFFHHDYATAHNGVHATIDFRVYACSENAPA